MFAANNPQAVARMYSSADSLRIRQQIHLQYSVPSADFVTWALGCLQWRGDEVVLDVGCGPGRWFRPLSQYAPRSEYVGIDLYPAMLTDHPAAGMLAQATAEHLPFPDRSFDVIMANHMLFHVPDLDEAIREFRRVLRPGGVLMATTNSVQTMPELQVLLRRAVTLLVPPGTTNIQVPSQHTDSFTLESGTRLLSRHFYAIVRHDMPGALVFPAVDPVLAYLESTRSVRELELPAGVVWDDMMMIVREQVNRLIEHFGELVINKLTGVLIATDQGDFIRSYLASSRQFDETAED